MSIDHEKLIQCMTEMKKIYLNDPTASVRSSSFITTLHDFCVDELRKAIDDSVGVQIIKKSDMILPRGKPHYPRTVIDPKKLQLMQEATLFGSHKNKDTDIVLSNFANGPQIIIGVRSQMSSVAKNIENYYEGIIGECISLHDRFPMAVIGYVYLLPATPIKPERNETVDLEKAEHLYCKITGRYDWRDTHDKYEHFAFIKVDFSTDPPTILNTCDLLKFDNFFEKLLATYNERNIFNQIKRK